jgi:hypothetical protein
MFICISMGQKTAVTGWRISNAYDSVSKVSGYVFTSGFKHSQDVSLDGYKVVMGANLPYATHLNIFSIVERAIKDHLFIIRIWLAGMNVVGTSSGYHVEISVYSMYSYIILPVVVNKTINVIISMIGHIIMTKYMMHLTWSVYYLNNEVDVRILKRLIKYTRPRSIKKGRIFTYKDIYSLKNVCRVIVISSYGNITSIMGQLIAGRVIRSSIHKDIIKSLNKLLDVYVSKMNGVGKRDDVKYGRKVCQGILIKVKGTVGGSRRTMTMTRQRGKITKGTISSAIVSSYIQAKTTTGTRGIVVSYIY